MRTARQEGRLDLVAEAEVNGRPVHIIVEAKHSVYPRDVRAAADQLRALAARFSERFDGRSGSAERSAVPLLAVPSLSPGSRALLRREGIGYWDSGGSLYVRLPWALFYVDRPAPKGAQRRATAVYRGRSAQVLHALLLEPERWWGVRELAAHAEVSPYTVHQVFTFLEAQLWAEKRGEGPGPGVVRRLTEPGALLDAWAQAHSLKAYVAHHFHAWTPSPAILREQVTKVLHSHGVEYGLTLASGAALVAPFGTETDRLTLVVPASVSIAGVADAAGLRPVDNGESIVLYATRNWSPLLFRRRINDTWVVSDVQLYLDLWDYPKRGKEQARHLRTERLGY